MRPYNQRSDFPTLLALIVAVGFPLLLLSMVFDVFPRQALSGVLGGVGLPWTGQRAQPSAPVAASPAVSSSPTPLNLTSPEWPVPGGYFFTQTNGRPALSAALGYSVTNTAGLLFWDEFQRLGGARSVGYPLSNRATWRGFTIQIFQKLVFQSADRGGEVSILNIMDELSAQGKDDSLFTEHLVPLPLPPELDADRPSEEVAAARLALLDDDPAIADFYRSSFDAVRRFGLPTSKVTDMGDHLVAIRCQRAVLQRWKQDMPWAKADEVTIANSGQIAIELGLFPAESLQPGVSAPPPTGSQAAPSPSPVP